MAAGILIVSTHEAIICCIDNLLFVAVSIVSRYIDTLETAVLYTNFKMQCRNISLIPQKILDKSLFILTAPIFSLLLLFDGWAALQLSSHSSRDV